MLIFSNNANIKDIATAERRTWTLQDMLNIKRYGLRGVSLMEVLVALFIMTVVGAAILAGTYVNIQSTKVAREGIRAEGLAKYELEYVKAIARNKWDWIPNQQTYPYTYTISSASTTSPSWDTAHNGSDLLDTEYKGYTVSITIDKMSGYDENIRKVTATVTYPGRSGASIETYVVKP
jgi:Tfp pilus assembly protein PilV